MKIGLLTPYCGGNRGDAAIQEALIHNIKRFLPNAEIHGFTLNPGEIERLHKIRSYYVAACSVRSYHLHLVPTEMARRAPNVSNLVKRYLKGFPFIYRLLRSVHQVLDVARREIAHIAMSYRVLKEFDLLVVAGGGQLDDLWGGALGHPYALLKWSLLSKATGTRFVFMSVGANYPRSLWSKIFYKISLYLASYRSYRDKKSREVVSSYFNAENDPCYPDLAFSLEPAGLYFPRSPIRSRPTIGIGPIAYCDPRSWPKKDETIYKRYVLHLSSFITWLLKQQFQIIFFTSTRPDTNVVTDLWNRLDKDDLPRLKGQIGQPPIGTVYDLLGVLSDVDYVVASRLHGVILSHLLSKPVISVSFDTKVDAYLLEIGQADYRLDIHDFTADGLREKLEKIHANHAFIECELTEKVKDFRQLLNAQYGQVIGSLGNAEYKTTG